MNTQMAHPETQSHKEDPHGVGFDHSGDHEEDHQGKKSVLKKVKDKAKKIKETLVKHGHSHDHDQDEEEDDDEEIVKDPEVHGAPIYESAAVRSFIGSSQAGESGNKVGHSNFELQEDPDAPKHQSQAISPGNYQTKVSDHTGTGGEEAEVTPMIRSFESLEVSDKSPTGNHDQFSPESKAENHPQSMDSTEQQSGHQSSYTKKLSAATSAIAGKAMSAKNAVSDKLAPVYEKVAEAGGAVASKMQSTGGSGGAGTDKGVSVKEYLVEKLKPSDEDKALSEVISEALHKRSEQQQEEPKRMGKVTESPQVANRLGSESDSGLGSGESPRKRVMDRLREAATSWYGKGGETNPSQAFYDSPAPGDNTGGGEERKLQEQQS